MTDGAMNVVAEDRGAVLRACQTFLARVPANLNYLTPPELLRILQTDPDSVYLLDNRTPEAYASGHIPGAKNVWMKDLLSEEALAQLPADRTIVVCCWVGHTASQVLTVLQLLGYDAVGLKYGMGEPAKKGEPRGGWLDYGYPTEQDQPVGSTPRFADGPRQSHTVTVGKVTRVLPIRTVAPGVRIAYVQLPGDVELCAAAAQALADQADVPCEVIAAPESKAVPLAHELARLVGKPYIVLRKSLKPYMTGAISERVSALTSATPERLWLDPLDAERVRGKRVWVVDDVITTGSTMRAAEALMTRSGATVSHRMAAFGEGTEFDDVDVIVAARLPLFEAAGSTT
ncbi:hypothetical protein GCM10023322_81980 [Rugosimonospora acidiphila]|uniref:Rhodanese domain-containing protein n=1 Tax=Rugosimonospora acidiphila TaxID=556531 RepID=A0ABP9SRX2_9ACTN